MKLSFKYLVLNLRVLCFSWPLKAVRKRLQNNERWKTQRKARAIWWHCLSIETALTHIVVDSCWGNYRNRKAQAFTVSARLITFDSDLKTHSLGNARHARVPKASEGCVTDCLISAQFPFFVQSGRMDPQPNTWIKVEWRRSWMDTRRAKTQSSEHGGEPTWASLPSLVNPCIFLLTLPAIVLYSGHLKRPGRMEPLSRLHEAE